MRNYLLTLLFLFSACFAQEVSAGDKIFGNCHYKELNGKYAGVQKTEGPAVWPTNDQVHMVYCLRMPKAKITATALVTPRNNEEVTINVWAIDCETNDTIVKTTVAQAGEANQDLGIQLFKDVDFPIDTWYRIELQAPDGYNKMSRLVELDFEHNAKEPVVDAHKCGFPIPAVHLWFDHSSMEGAPQDESYEWCYQEVMMPKKWVQTNTYLMTLGITGGYMGIQMAGRTVNGDDTRPETWVPQALFSIWDDGDTDLTPNLPDYLKAGALAHGPGIEINRFGAEGTGCQSMHRAPADWEPGDWVSFLCCARPEEISVTLKDQQGNDSIIKYPCSILSAWYKTIDDPEWNYLATIRHAGESHYWKTWYSFLELWADTGGELFRRAYWRNNYQRSIGSGKWYFIDKVGLFSATTYESQIAEGKMTARERRFDYGHGAASDEPRGFYMQAGGYGQTKDSANVVAIPDDHSCVESINLDSLLKQVDMAIMENNKVAMTNMATGDNNVTSLRNKMANLLAKADRFEGFRSEDLAPIAEAYKDESLSARSLSRTIKALGNAVPLKYGNTNKTANISSFRAYQLLGKNGVLVAKGGEVVATPQDATDVTDPYNNWLVIRHDNESYYCVYNIGAECWLAVQSGKPCLSAYPHKFNLPFNNTEKTFAFRCNNRYVSINSKCEVKGVTSNTQDARYQLLDNYYMAPDRKLCYELLEATTSDVIGTGIEDVEIPVVGEDDNASLSDDVIAVAYYDLEGRRVGYALSKGTYVAHMLLKNGSAIVKKIVVE